MLKDSKKPKDSFPSKAMLSMSEERRRFKTRQATEEVCIDVQNIY